MEGHTEAPGTFMWRIGDTYNMLWKMIIRPPRDVYSLEELGPNKFRLGKRVYERRDLQLKSPRGHLLECSHFVPAKQPDAKRPCIVYLHGNCSSRLEAFDALPVLLPRNLTVFSLDLSGSGRSEGDYISLGHHEEKDLRVVLKHLRASGSVASIGLWGRSMGAATAILCAEDDHELAACVLDSPFGDLRIVAQELVSRGRFAVPQFLVNMGLEVIRNEVRARADFDPHELNPIRCAPNASCPALFGVAQDDHFVLPHHTQDLHDAWKSERILRVFDGGHNGVRPAWFLEEAASFLVDRLTSASDSGREEGTNLAGPRRCALGARLPYETCPTTLETEDERRKAEIAQELIKMGFAEDAAFEAASSYVQGDTSTSAPSHGPSCTPSRKPTPTLMKTDSNNSMHDSFDCDDTHGDNRVSGTLVSGGLSLRQTNLGSPRQPVLPDKPPAEDDLFTLQLQNMRPPSKGARVIDHLLYLGFKESRAEEASRRTLTVEDAIEYLASQRVSVRL